MYDPDSFPSKPAVFMDFFSCVHDWLSIALVALASAAAAAAAVDFHMPFRPCLAAHCGNAER